MTLDELQVGKDAVIQSVGGEGALRRHFLDMGLIPGTEVTLMKVAPMGDPVELRIRGYELTLRKADAARIEIQDIHDSDYVERQHKHEKDIPHPQVGEMGIYQKRESLLHSVLSATRIAEKRHFSTSLQVPTST